MNGAVLSVLYASGLLLESRGVLPAAAAPVRLAPQSLWVQVPAAIVLLDFVTYLLHRAYHRIPLLWRLHLVHHTDLDLDVSSASRFHTGEVALSALVKLGVVVLLGIAPAGLVAFEIAMLACAQFQHANVRVPPGLERLLWRSFVPPAMHRIHHAPNPRDTDSNYGTILTLWDGILGSLNRRPPESVLAFGLERFRDPDELGLRSLVTIPFGRRATSGS